LIPVRELLEPDSHRLLQFDRLFLLRHAVPVYCFNGKYSEFVLLPQYFRVTK